MQHVPHHAQTNKKQNIERAQKEIDRLEAEAKEPQPSSSSHRRSHESSKKPASANQAVNGTASASAEHAQEKDAEDMKKALLENKADE